MKQLGTVLLSKQPFSEIVIGNTAIVRAMIESGTLVVTSYPGSPTPEIAEAIKSIPTDQRPFYFEFSTNEKVATEVAYGASVNGHLSCVFFKSVGLNVAADTFVQLGHMNLTGGMVIVWGDDPGAHSSQNEQDNRHFALLSYTPVLEPATPAEVYSFYKEAARISVEKGMPVVLRLTTHVCHQKEKVSFGGWDPKPWDKSPRFDPKNGPYIPITTEVFPMKRRALKRLAELSAAFDASPMNRSEDHKNRDRGIITFGTTYLSLMDTLRGVAKKPDILKLGTIHPLPLGLIQAFLESHREVKILEELDAVIEPQVKALAYDKGIATRISGKRDAEEWIGEYTPDKVYGILRREWPDMLPEKAARPAGQPYAPKRPAQMCPGCGHRSAFYAIKRALAATDIKVGDIGCHSLGFLPPYQMNELLMCMGASVPMGSGLSLFQTERKVVAFLGDSTFFHAGLPGIVNAIFNRHRVTLIIMENGTTAMTGHQDHPAVGKNFNEITEAIPVRRVLEGLGVKHIFEVDAYQQGKLIELVKRAVEIPEFSVVIAKHPCMLKYMREQRRKPDFKEKQVMVPPELCDGVHECVEKFACPTFTRLPNGKVTVNTDLCIGDGSCIQTCPSKAIKPKA